MDDSILRMIYLGNKISSKELQQITGCSKSQLGRVMKSTTNKRNIIDVRNRNTVENYFECIQTEEQAYYLGFFIADGCIKYNNGRKPVATFTLQDADSYMLEKFSEAINNPYKLTCSTKIRDTGYISTWYTMRISSQKIVSNLEDIGAGYGKSYREIPILPPNLTRHLVRGLFDGDGSFYYRRSHPEDLNSVAIRGCIELLGFPVVIEDLQMILNDIGVSKYSLRKSDTDTQLYAIRIERKEDIKLFYNYMYTDSHIYLERKKKKFEDFFNGIIPS